MSALLITKVVTIGGLAYTLRRLNVAKSREALAIVQKLLGGFEIGDGPSEVSPVFMAGLAGALSEAELSKLVDLFGPATTVDMNDGAGNTPSRELTLSKAPAQDELWSGQLELMIDWLDESIKFNFAGVIAKTHAVVQAANKARAAAKAGAETE